MGRVKEAKASGDLEEACRQLLAYYTRSDNAARLRREQPRQSNRTEALADTILKNVFVIQNVRGKCHGVMMVIATGTTRGRTTITSGHGYPTDIASFIMCSAPTLKPGILNAMYIDEFLRDFIIKACPTPA